ncbi:uncharacterized protein PHALS_13987 [Plasmopara halstedii]|uniref:Transmembrane protein n=1 Tax=Plasmopara halstedii TaxID=4781 RepID=A0A0P1AQ67_PLAHL|nr:uncharacterized protein PHALS_13987 [Plasmopara halstedii]CEG43693.1 hypothetical protein PHALS_13987 [Plasmopara halstedii]|eukprot:XP_024580062.1 hypothetical protein PHALS_13987 [Plasmopara halstedii]
MGRPKISVAAVGLSAATGMTVAVVSMMAYFRFQHPQEFVDATIRMTHPELTSDVNRKWGLFGTGIMDSVPQSVRNLFHVPDMAERFEMQKKKRDEQIRQTIEDLRPKGK